MPKLRFFSCYTFKVYPVSKSNFLVRPLTAAFGFSEDLIFISPGSESESTSIMGFLDLTVQLNK